MKIVDGNKACASIAYLFSEICPLYPITPASPMGSTIDEMANNNELNFFDKKVKLITMQSEAGAAAALHGALLSGNLASTFTASQGLLLMIPDMYKIAGEMLPGVIHVASRALATHALSIFGDHQDVYAARNTGFCILASSNVEEAQNMAAIAHLSAIKGSIPFIHFFDGFRTSHEINKIPEINKEELKKLLPVNEIEDFRNRMLLGKTKNERGLAQNEDVFFQISESRNQSYLEMPYIVKEYMDKINKITNNRYQPFTYYGHPYPTKVIVAMGSVNDTIKLVVDDLVNKGQKVGMLKVTLFRPFSKDLFVSELPTSATRIAVLDRGKDATMSGEPLYLDVINALNGKKAEIVGGRYGLASKNTTPAMIKGVFDMLDGNLINNFTVGINDDVTKLSIPIPKDYNVVTNYNEIEIFGFGSDGMVSASKNIMKVLGEKNYVQGYYEYDSKKSNGLTISHLRYYNKPINAPFYPTEPKLVVITKDTYLSRLEMLEGIKEYGTVIINTDKQIGELSSLLPKTFLDTVRLKNVKLYIIDASKIAKEAGIKGKISKIMETIILKTLNVNNYEEIVNESIKKAFLTKGDEVINANLNAVKSAMASLQYVNEQIVPTFEVSKENNVVSLINNRKGSKLNVSALAPLKDGAFPCATSKYEKRMITHSVPKWIPENCISCNQCSLVCPHAVIRPFIVSKDAKGIPLVGNDNYNFMISVSEADCTGCGLCEKACPGKAGKKAIEFGPFDQTKQDEANELFNNHKNPDIIDKYNIRGSQFQKPLFEFSGACAGCGETPYIKLLTQLVGEKLVIANATGCSSIYGGSMPSTPYLVPWANSLFEDNAEFGLGILLGYNNKREKVREVISNSVSKVSGEQKRLYELWLNNSEDFKDTSELAKYVRENNIVELRDLVEFIPSRSVWTIGGDGWAYDIGYSGIDHALSSGENVNILVLDTEVYSNTGGQASKSSQMGQVCEFANFGKKTLKKDLFARAMTIPNVYVANICLSANPMQAIKAFKEAEEHTGPSIIIAYAPCLEQGIKGGLTNATNEQKLAVECGYVMLMRYSGNLVLDSKEPDFEKYKAFLENEVRYSALKLKDESLYESLINEQISYAKKKYNHYKEIADQAKKE